MLDQRLYLSSSVVLTSKPGGSSVEAHKPPSTSPVHCANIVTFQRWQLDKAMAHSQLLERYPRSGRRLRASPTMRPALPAPAAVERPDGFGNPGSLAGQGRPDELH